MLHPSKVGVQNKDYYPLVEVLKKLNKLDLFKDWKPLKDYVDKEMIIEPIVQIQKSDLELIKENLAIMSWTEKKDDGLEGYTRKNCKKAETIILGLLNQLEILEQNDFVVKEELIKEGVLKFNKRLLSVKIVGSRKSLFGCCSFMHNQFLNF